MNRELMLRERNNQDIVSEILDQVGKQVEEYVRARESKLQVKKEIDLNELIDTRIYAKLANQ